MFAGNPANNWDWIPVPAAALGWLQSVVLIYCILICVPPNRSAPTAVFYNCPHMACSNLEPFGTRQCNETQISVLYPSVWDLRRHRVYSEPAPHDLHPRRSIEWSREPAGAPPTRSRAKPTASARRSAGQARSARSLRQSAPRPRGGGPAPVSVCLCVCALRRSSVCRPCRSGTRAVQGPVPFRDPCSTGTRAVQGPVPHRDPSRSGTRAVPEMLSPPIRGEKETKTEPFRKLAC